MTAISKHPIKVCVTGAAGQIAYSLLYNICNGSVFGQDQVRLNWIFALIIVFLPQPAYTIKSIGSTRYDGEPKRFNYGIGRLCSSPPKRLGSTI